jgi:hypothetical protein
VDAVDDQSHDLSFPEPPEGLLTAPENRVVAQMDGQDSVAAAIDALAEAGFDREAIYVLCGPEGAKRLDVSGVDHGLRGRIYRVVEWIGDERAVLLRLEEHLAAGGLMVSVPADHVMSSTAARILGEHGAHGMAHFGKGHWEPLGP